MNEKQVIAAFLGALQEIDYSEDGTIRHGPHLAVLDGENATAQMVLDDHVDNDMKFKPLVLRAKNVDNAVDVDFNTVSGAKTVTFSVVNQVLVLLGAPGGKWIVLASLPGAAFTQTYATATATHAARTAAALTDNSGGTASETLADVTEANNAGSADRVPTEDAIASLAAQCNALRADQLNTAGVLNSLIDELQKRDLIG